MVRSILLRSIARVAMALLFLVPASCREPIGVVPAVELRAITPDSTHIDIEFPEALDPVAMADTGNIRVEVLIPPEQAGRAVAVRRAAVSDSIDGRMMQLETTPIPDGVFLRVTFRSVRLLTGPRLARQPVTIGLVSGLSYWKDIAPLFAQHCNQCHSGLTPSGEYATDSFFALFGSGSSPPGNLIPGDLSSLLVRKCLSSGSMFWGGGLESIDEETIRSWVVYYLARQ